MADMSKATKRSPSSTRLRAASALLLALPGAAHGQSVNYAELEAMFGEPVTTSVTGKPQRASEAPASLIIITRDDIRRSPANDIPGLIRAYAGVDLARWTSGQSDVAIRGGLQPSSPRLLVLVNGRQVYLDHYGMTNWAGLGVQLEEIQQIEIVSGPNSALFGFNAVSGVINIITINPLYSPQLTMTAEAGTEGHRRVSGVAAIKLSDWLGLRVSGGFEKSDELDGLATSPLKSQISDLTFKPRHYEVAGELYAKLGEGTDASLSASYSENRHLEIPPVLFTLPTDYKFNSLAAQISHDTGWGVLSGRIFRNASQIEMPFGRGDEGLSWRNKALVASADVLIRAGTSNLGRIGVEYRQNQLRLSPGYPGTTYYDVYAGSGMWESQLSDAIRFTVGARLDHLDLQQKGIVNQPTIFVKEDFDRQITAWSFNSALIFKLNDMNSLRISGGRGIQAPSLYSFGARLDFPITGTPLSFVLSGNPAVEPAKIWSAEIGLTHGFERLDGRLQLTAFYNRTSDIISDSVFQTPPIATPPTYPFVLSAADNVGTFEVYGIEASLTGRFAPSWSWAANYSWAKAHQRIAGNSGNVFQRPLALDSATPEHKIKAQLSYEQGPWLATIAARYSSDIKQLLTTDPEARSPLVLIDVEDSLALDAKLAFKINESLTVAIAGENLTGAAGVDLSPAPAERRLRASVQIRF